MNRRTMLQGFALAAEGLFVPEPARVYSFAGGWKIRKLVVFMEGSVPIGAPVDWAIGDIIRRLDANGMRPVGDASDVLVELAPAPPAWDLPHLTILRIPILGAETTKPAT